MTADVSPQPNSPARILIVDDHPAVREGLALRISRHPDLVVCGEAGDIPEAVALVEAERPDAAVVDIQLQAGYGIDLIRRIRTRNHDVRILVWSMYPESLYAERALRAGAQGYITKEHATGRIVEAIRCILSGKVYLSEAMTAQLLQMSVGKSGRSQRDSVESLSDRELEVFTLIGRGLTMGEISERLCLSAHTVETHRQRIKVKLNLKSAAELTRAAVQWFLHASPSGGSELVES